MVSPLAERIPARARILLKKFISAPPDNLMVMDTNDKLEACTA